ncbi:ER membrane complex subunit 6 [Dermatophagoides pteronyssinus]|uniref:ER membrane protein complex subunit 6 n=1 Tax=Dermatophagoides pteronyssinus TaxID=6956 RepID=A0ABQ8J354_DERPT|nr:ER membrane complex subunit 6 [Dermatophagoides pteronyssinus]
MIKPSNSKLQNSNIVNNNVITSPPIAYSSFAITHNNHLIEYCRTSMSALAGSTAGIIGLTSLYGFAFYILMVIILWFMIMSKAGPNYQRYFTSPWHVLTNGFMGGLTTYVLFWTFLYGMVHVY